MADLSFASPLYLVLLALPPLIFRLAPASASGGIALRVPEGVRAHLETSGGDSNRSFLKRFGPAYLIWFLMVMALAGPRQVAPTEALPVSGRDLMLALDLSGSMVREDFFLEGQTVTRLDALREVGANFVRRRGGDRVGLVVFGSEAYVAASPSHDVNAVADAVESMVIGISGRATNIGDAIGISLKRLENSDAETKVIILLSDGESNAGDVTPTDVAKLARDMNVKIHTIAMGPRDLATSPGERGAVDAKTLETIAMLSGGEMFRVQTTEDLISVTDAINALEPTARAGLAAEIYRELWIYPAFAAALGCLWLGWREVA